eukprot:TRINITY_DN5621_c0_g2_i2.p2 TRINITY_DN5621_c0_g2~~TRINITY_DN5621_c0_g2_i2.p2  ORF type:complete len:576 (+),score=183.84 TRINITY_DN5621_c0_g2_i2:63-1790(+)
MSGNALPSINADFCVKAFHVDSEEVDEAMVTVDETALRNGEGDDDGERAPYLFRWTGAVTRSQCPTSAECPLSDDKEPCSANCNVLGRGGFGGVYLVDGTVAARNDQDAPTTLTGQFAMKRMKGEQYSRAAAEAEVRMMELVQCCRTVVRLYEARVENHEAVLVLELCESSLRDAVKYAWCVGTHKALVDMDAFQLLTVLIDAGDAVAQCHSCGILHSDLKLDNVLLSGWVAPEGAQWRGRLCDFGMAAFVANAQTRTVFGLTLSYAPPEYFNAEWECVRQYPPFSAARTPPRVGAQAVPTLGHDVYSFAVVCIEALSLAFMPYTPDDPDALLRHALHVGVLLTSAWSALGLHWKEAVDTLFHDGAGAQLRKALAKALGPAADRPTMNELCEVLRYARTKLRGDGAAYVVDANGRRGEALAHGAWVSGRAGRPNAHASLAGNTAPVPLLSPGLQSAAATPGGTTPSAKASATARTRSPPRAAEPGHLISAPSTPHGAKGAGKAGNLISAPSTPQSASSVRTRLANTRGPQSPKCAMPRTSPPIGARSTPRTPLSATAAAARWPATAGGTDNERRQ